MVPLLYRAPQDNRRYAAICRPTRRQVPLRRLCQLEVKAVVAVRQEPSVEDQLGQRQMRNVVPRVRRGDQTIDG